MTSLASLLLILAILTKSATIVRHSSYTAPGFESSVCGAIFTTEEDGKHHLEKKAHDQLRNGTMKQDNWVARD